MRAVAIGISSIRSRDGRGVPFAASDAKRLAKHCGSEAEAICDSAATIATVAQAIKSLAATEETSPVIVLLITAARISDGRLSLELADGPVDLVELLSPLWKTARGSIVVGLDLARGFDQLPSGWSEAIGTLMEMMPAAPGRTLLLSASAEETSRVSGELQAGIWAYHLAEALGGREAKAREFDGRLTANSISSYLVEEINESLRRAYLEPVTQTPQIFADSPHEVLAIRADGPTAPSSSNFGAALELRSEELMPVNQLAGFRKGIHKVPSDALKSSQEWVRQLAAPDLRALLEETASRLRQELGYRRRQLRPSNPVAGEASIITPDFAVHLSVEQLADSPGMARFRRMISDIADPACLAWESLTAAFPQGFTSLHQRSTAPTDVAALIDMLEEADVPAIVKIDYPMNLAYCELTLAGLTGTVRINAEGIAISSESPLPPTQLARQFATVRQLLGGRSDQS